MTTTIRSTCCLVAALATGCEPARADRDPPELERADIVRYHMRLHFDDLRAIQGYLVDGKLKEAKALAFLIANPEKDRGLLPWAAESRDLVAAATALAKATSIDAALRLEVKIAVACANCHDHTAPAFMFPTPGRPPLADHASSTVRMTRHRWATDRLWEGLVANSEDHWRAGLAVISETPLPYSRATDAPVFASALQKSANQALRDAPISLCIRRPVKYDAVVLGCAVRFRHPAIAMRTFVAKNRKALATRPTAFFAVDGTKRADVHVATFFREARWKPDASCIIPGIRGARLRRAYAWLQDRFEAKSIKHVQAPTDWKRIEAFADDIASRMIAPKTIAPARGGLAGA